MTPLEKLKKEVEIANVRAARMNMELRIEICKDEIQRLQEQIQISINKEQSLEKELK